MKISSVHGFSRWLLAGIRVFKDNPWGENTGEPISDPHKEETKHGSSDGSSSSRSGKNGDDPRRGDRRNGGPEDPFADLDPFLIFKKYWNQLWGSNRKNSTSWSRGSGSSPGGSVTSIVLLIILGGSTFWGLSGFYRVQEGELAVVTRFGHMVRISPAGLRYHFPSPVEEVAIVKVAAVNTIQGGMAIHRESDSGEGMEKTLILTGDENMVHTDYTVLWKIKDVKEFLFQIRHPESAIKIIGESVIREVMGQTTARSALTEGRDGVGIQAQEKLQQRVDHCGMGIQILSIQLQNVSPPAPVVEAFNSLQASLTDADRLRNEAEAYRNDILPKARGQAVQIAQQAEAYYQTKIAEAQGESDRFEKVYAAYRKNPNLAMDRLYFSTMNTLLSRMQVVIVDPKIGHSVLPHLPLGDKLPKVPLLETETPRIPNKGGASS